ncbi:hypothetical protein [Cylindrospermum sp. FACHB-282]|uniref:hypothetical protein n=1 Tax=Cylindrospermum sp. FACHB-282 TaxID=2692794 RepID=UPI00168546F0|nr:hypothetical protein [Cylindrospermum sp. FACHB-282]MBD2388818.1 hypothetical protein [Cylindrospermum sp. FACHB-282]
MTKPIGYYTGLVPGGDSLLNSLETQYGATFERMTRREKLYLMFSLAVHLFSKEEGAIRDEITIVASDLQALLPSDQEGLMEALINQIRWGHLPEPEDSGV